MIDVSALGGVRLVPRDAAEALRKMRWWDDFYSSWHPQQNLPISDWELQQFQRHIAPFARTAVDVGCGWGLMAQEMASEGLWTTGYDWSHAAVEGARSLTAGIDRVRFRWHDFLAPQGPPDIEPESVDVLSCRLVLPYLPLNRFLSQACSWLKPDTGVMYVVVQVWENQDPGMRRGYPDSIVEDIRVGWRTSSRWDLDPAGEVTALALTGPPRRLASPAGLPHTGESGAQAPTPH
ncbi:class I SAM-dependent methyltransferase [Streptomyces sp. NPDC059070]|uniref:class I SAM-dependent methyltransferase n=1 Tax=Streptomyces sp. NPDC059070 TaxID=3346713 RepID=UPI003686FB2D